MGSWLQWYAFDVIGAITFHRRFGFMEEQKDVRGMIGAIESALRYASIAGQISWVHGWMMGSQLFTEALAAQPFVHVPDPLRTIVKVSLPFQWL